MSDDKIPMRVEVLAEEPDDAIREDIPIDTSKPRTLWGDAWYDLKHNKIFWMSALMMVVRAWRWSCSPACSPTRRRRPR